MQCIFTIQYTVLHCNAWDDAIIRERSTRNVCNGVHFIVIQWAMCIVTIHRNALQCMGDAIILR